MATLSYSMSLTPLFFGPLANKDWSTKIRKKSFLHGSDGAILKTEDGSSSVTVAPEEIRLKSKAVYLEAEDIFPERENSHCKSEVHCPGQSPDEGYNRFADIGPLNVEMDAVINGVSVSGHSHDVTGVQSGGSTITSKQPNPG